MGARTQRERGSEARLWLCPRCRGVHTERRCRRDDLPDGEDTTCLDGAVHLCACCCRVPVAHDAPYSSFFCADCGPRVVEVNRRAGRLVVPVCRDPRANSALVPPNEADGAAVEHATRRLDRQIEDLSAASFRRTADLLWTLRLREPVWVPLEEYLEGVAELRADVFQPGAALRQLLAAFSAHVLDTPDDSPALQASVEDAARAIVSALDAGEARALTQSGPAVVREFGRVRAWAEIDRVLPVPSFLPARDNRVLRRRAPTIQALVGAVVEELENTHGPTRRPVPPAVDPDLEIVVQANPGEHWPEAFPDHPSEDAHVVVGLQGPPSDPDNLLTVYHLCRDGRRRWWILWAEVEDEAEEGMFAPAPAAWCRAGRLSPASAAYALLEAFLAADRMGHGPGARRPEVRMAGLLDEDLADVVLDRVWSSEATRRT